MKRELLGEDQKEYRVVGMTMFLVAVGLVLMRIVSFFVSRYTDVNDTLLDVIFSVPMQLGILLLMPFCVYKFCLKKRTSELLRFSNVRKTKPVNYPIAVGIGFCGFVLTVGISFVWQVILMIFGYQPTSSATDFPERFNVWFFLLQIFLTAILPGICEEFATRGGFLTVLKKTFPFATMLMLSALAFGLFHQNIRQVFYTACFGALMAFVTIKTKSIFPAMIIHFINNGISVFLDFAEFYRWKFFGDIFQFINDSIGGPGIFLLVLIFIAAAGGLYALLRLIVKYNDGGDFQPEYAHKEFDHSKPVPRGRQESITKYIVTNAPALEVDRKLMYTRTAASINMFARIDPFGNESLQEMLQKQTIVYYRKRFYMIQNNVLYPMKPMRGADTDQFRPKLKDNAFFIAAIVLTVITTVFSFVWGLII